MKIGVSGHVSLPGRRVPWSRRRTSWRDVGKGQVREVEEGGGRGREPRAEQRGMAVLLWEDRHGGDPEWWSVQKRLRIVGYADVTGKSQVAL